MSVMAREDLNLDSDDNLMRFLKEPTLQIAETLTGILASDQKDWKLSAGRLVQGVVKGKLLTQLGREIERYREEGRIKEDYFATHRTQVSLFELLKFLDEQVPDEEVFKALKSIFFSGVSIDASEQDELMAYEFLQTAKNLSGTEVLILKANFAIVQGTNSVPLSTDVLVGAKSNRNAWRRVIAAEAGLGEMDSIVEKYEPNLETLGLISPRSADNRFASDYTPTQRVRLTESGYRFCEFITQYE